MREVYNTDYMGGWLAARARLNQLHLKTSFSEIDEISIVFRVGGQFGDFGGGYGFERRRYVSKSRYVTCDFVFQANAVLEDTSFFSRKQAQTDVQRTFEHLAEHHTVKSNPLGCELLRAKVKSTLVD